MFKNILSWTIYHQVQMVEQQELKSYNLLSTNSLVEFNANDPRLEEMWYIVSACRQLNYWIFSWLTGQ